MTGADAFDMGQDSDGDTTSSGPRRTRLKKARNQDQADEDESAPRSTRVQVIVDILQDVKRSQELFGHQELNSNQISKILATQPDVVRDSKSETLIGVVRVALTAAMKKGLPDHWNVIEADGKTLYQLQEQE